MFTWKAFGCQIWRKADSIFCLLSTVVDVKNGRNPCNQPIDKNMNNPNDNEGGCDEDDHVDGEDNIIYDGDDYGNGEDLYSPFLTPH